VYDTLTGDWQVIGSSAGAFGIDSFGGPGFVPAPGDYDGNGSTNIGIYKIATSEFFVGPSGARAAREAIAPPMEPSSAEADVDPAQLVPAPADYDGDGRTDFGTYNVVTGAWSYSPSSGGPPVDAMLGGAGFRAAPADFDGDGKVDVAVYQPATGKWTYLSSEAGTSQSLPDFGGAGRFVPVPADYDGDGKADQALYQKKKGKWRFLLSTTGMTSNFTGIGGAGWFATPGDFDGDGKVDAGAYRPSTGSWRYQSSSTGLRTILPKLGGPGFAPAVGLCPYPVGDLQGASSGHWLDVAALALGPAVARSPGHETDSLGRLERALVARPRQTPDPVHRRQPRRARTVGTKDGRTGSRLDRSSRRSHDGADG
jgi:hypothetical protein